MRALNTTVTCQSRLGKHLARSTKVRSLPRPPLVLLFESQFLTRLPVQHDGLYAGTLEMRSQMFVALQIESL